MVNGRKKPSRKPKLYCVLLTDRRKIGGPVYAVSKNGGATLVPDSVRTFTKKREAEQYARSATGPRRIGTVHPWP